jgi:hypothetical protein
MPIISKIYHSSGKLTPDLLAKDGPIVDLEIAVPNILRDYLVKNNKNIPEVVKGKGLIDTGAAVSCIDDSIATKLNVKPTGVARGHGMSGESIRNLYSVQISIVAAPQQKWTFESTRIMGVEIEKQGLIALIGRDFLRNGIMIYSGFSGIVDLGI